MQEIYKDLLKVHYSTLFYSNNILEQFINDLNNFLLTNNISEQHYSPELMKKLRNGDYGQELILDIHGVPMNKYKGKHIKEFASKLCGEIGMISGPIYVWGSDKSLGTMHNPKADGISCIQFLHSSSILIHAIDTLNRVFINIFSCERFDPDKAEKFALKYFEGEIKKRHNIVRD